jgi:hypothetical protein
MQAHISCPGTVCAQKLTQLTGLQAFRVLNRGTRTSLRCIDMIAANITSTGTVPCLEQIALPLLDQDAAQHAAGGPHVYCTRVQ